MERINQLRQDIARRELELEALREELAVAEHTQAESDGASASWKWPLQPHEYDRYSRQMIVPKFGLQGVFSVLAFSRHPQDSHQLRCTRTNTLATSKGSCCRSWRSWLPCCSIPRWRRSEYTGSRRWRLCRDVKSAPTDSAFHGESRHEQSGQRSGLP